MLSSAQAFERTYEKGSHFAFRDTTRVYERPRPFTIDHISLVLTLDHEKSRLKGVAELKLRRVDASATELLLDAVAFEVDSVRLKALGRGPWRAIQTTYDGQVLRIPVGLAIKTAIIQVVYRAAPRRGMYFLRPDRDVPTRPNQIWTQCQDEDARHVFPCHDKPHIKQTMEVVVHVKPGWFVLSNGDLVNNKRMQAKGTFHYKMRDRQPTYLFSIVAGHFAKVHDAVGKLAVDYYVPQKRKDDARRTFGHTPDMIRLFSRLTGVAYPWSKYAQIVVSDFIFGGMENTSATTMYEHILLDKRAAIDISSDELIAHELAHQWFGNFVTCRDWSHAWLNEGFATFMEHVWREHDLGIDAYEQGLRTDLRAYLAEANTRYQRPVVCQDYEAPIDVFDRHLYEKGALFLHTLRRKLGDNVFWQGVGQYLEKHGGGVVETRDLLRALEGASGQSLEQDFEQAIFRPGHIKLDVHVEYENDQLLLHTKQTLATGEPAYVFDLEFDVAMPGRKKPLRQTRRVNRGAHTFVIQLANRPGHIVIDPQLRILGRVNVKAPTDMLRHQLEAANSARGRIMAAEALSIADEPQTLRALGKALQNTRLFWGTRAAAAAALGNMHSDQAFIHLKKAVKVKEPKVRRAVVAALGHFRTEASAKLLVFASQNDESVLVSAAACRALGSTRQDVAFDALIALIDKPSWGEVIRSGAIRGLARLQDDRSLAVLHKQTRYGVSTRARRTAISALPSLSSSRKTRERLEELLEDPDPYLRVSVVEALSELGDVKSRTALRRQLDRDLDGRVRRRIRETLRDMVTRGRRETRRVQEELDSLRRSHAELRASLNKLEARVQSGE